MVEFQDKGAIRTKIYPFDWEVKDKNCQPIIVKTYNEDVFSVNHSVWKVLTQEEDVFL